MAISKGRALSATVNSATSLIKSSIDGTVTTTTIEQSAQQYANAEALPSVGNTFGEMALVQSTNRMYVWNGSGWYNVALINTNPTFTTPPLGSYQLDGDSPRSTLTITVAASDPESLGVSFSFETGGQLDSIADITQDSSVFTIVPKGNDSIAEGTYTGSLTIKTTDGVNIVPAVSSITLSFITFISHSNATQFLLKAVGTGNNQSPVDASTSTHALTMGGTSAIGTFSPYRVGGYSVAFEYGDELEFADNAAYDIGTSQFSAEAWVFPTAGVNNYSCGIISQFSSASRGWGLTFNNTEIKFYGSSNGGSSTNTVHTATYKVQHYKWTHIVVTRDNTNIRIFADGELILAAANTAHYHNSTQPLRIGDANATTSENFQGYMRDVRLVVGSIPTDYQTTSTTVNSGIFTPPTQPLTAITNTVLLACHANHLIDGSTNNVVPSTNATPTLIAFGPYESRAYTAAANGGSFIINNEPAGNIETTDKASNEIQLGTGDFTIELWHHPFSVSSFWEAIMSKRYATTGGWRIYKDSGNGYIKWYRSSTNSITTSSAVLRDNVWTHIAVVRNSGTMTIYANGVAAGSASDTYDYTTSTAGEIEIGAGSITSELPAEGHISDVRIVVGTAVYTGAFKPPSGPLTTTGGTYPSTTNVNTSIPSGHTKLLLNLTQGKVIDKSQRNNVILTGAVASSAQQHFSENTVLFDGNNDYADIDNPISGTEDHTHEAWVYPTGGDATYKGFFSSASTGSGGGISVSKDKAIGPQGGSADLIVFNPVVPDNEWSHVVLQRSEGVHSLYRNGVLQGISTQAVDFSNPKIRMGSRYYDNTNRMFGGHIHDFRVSKGLSRFPFIPVKQTLTTTNSQRSGVTVTASNVTLLTCHAATITDGSSNGTSITTNGNAAVSNFGPAAGMKSVYFDGTGDYLQCTLADTLGTADWTVEYWVYHNSVSGNQIHCAFDGYAPAFYRRNASDAFAVYHNPGISGNHNTNITPVAHKWYHMAYCHDDSDNLLRVFANGALVDSFAYTGNISGTTFRIGDDGTSAWMNGYISNLRIVKSTVVYSQNFTPTTSALSG